MANTLGIDLDGCLSDFTHAFGDLLVQVSGEDKMPTDWKAAGWRPPVWDWNEYYGYSSEVTKEVWHRIKLDPIFWFKLQPLAGAVEFLAQLNEASQFDAVYFITDRPGVATQLQTQLWLGEQGYSGPNVIVSSKKGELCRILNITYYLDDKGENIQDVREKSPDTHVYCLNTPYNESFGFDVGAGVHRVNRLDEFAEAVGLGGGSTSDGPSNGGTERNEVR